MQKRRLNNAQDIARARLQSQKSADFKIKKSEKSKNPRSTAKNFEKNNRSTAENRPSFEKRSENRKIPRSTPKNFEKTEGIRISKLLAQKGIASRREADFLIESGLVLVDGKVAVLGQRALESANIEVLEKAQKIQQSRKTILLNKPLGYVSNQTEKNYPHALSLLTAENFAGDKKRLKGFVNKGFAPAGRLDINSTGLMIYTQNGRLAKKIIDEKSEIEKEYLVRVAGEMVENGLELLNHGLVLDGAPLKPARVKRLNENQLHFILKEGKKRQIRRMCALVGLKVLALKRVRIGRLKLGNLPLGQWRFLEDFENI